MQNKVEELRKCIGLNQEDLAKALKVSRQTISSIETGKYNPSLELAFQISDFLKNQSKKFLFMKGDVKMKKDNLYVGLASLFIGGICLVIALNFESGIRSLLFGFAGAGIGPRAVMLWKYYYWTRPENRKRYQEKIENENIELHDERKTMLRDKSGRYAYLIGFAVISVSMVVFSILGNLGIIQNSELIILYLGGYLLFQCIIGVVIFNHLNKKY